MRRIGYRLDHLASPVRLRMQYGFRCTELYLHTRVGEETEQRCGTISATSQDFVADLPAPVNFSADSLDIVLVLEFGIILEFRLSNER